MEFPKSYIQSAPTIAEAIILKIYYSLQASPAALPSSPSSPSSSPSTSPSTSFLYQILFLNAQDIFSYTHSMMQVCFRNNGLVSFFHGIRALQIREYPHLMACFSAHLSPLVYSVTHFGFFLDSCFFLSHSKNILRSLNRTEPLPRTGCSALFARPVFSFEHFRSDQRTQHTWVLDLCRTPDQEEKLIYDEVEEDVEFSTLMSDSFEAEPDSCLDVVMHALAITAAV